MNNFDVSLKGLKDAYYQMNNYNFTRDNSGNRVLVEKQTGKLIYDEYLINKYRMVFAWLNTIKSCYESVDANATNVISKETEDLAFSDHAHKIYAILMENVRKQLLNGVNKSDLSSGNISSSIRQAIRQGLDSEGLLIADRLIFEGGSSASATVNWVSYAIPKLENEIGHRTK